MYWDDPNKVKKDYKRYKGDDLAERAFIELMVITEIRMNRRARRYWKVSNVVLTRRAWMCRILRRMLSGRVIKNNVSGFKLKNILDECDEAGMYEES